MANVQPEHGYTKIADEILEQMARIKLSPTQYRILFIVWRFTYGFNRKEHDLSLSFIANATGCDKRQLQREIKGLEQRKVIVQKVVNGVGRKIKFNKNHDEWIGKTAIGEITIGETDNGEIIEGSIGETVNPTIGETDNQEIHSLKTILKTEEEEELSESEILNRSVQVEKHYCQKRGIRDASSKDFHEIKILIASKIPVEFIKESVDRSFQEYKPKYERDEIRTFSYCATAVYDNWAKHLEKIKPVAKDEIPNQIIDYNPAQRRGKSNKQILPFIAPDSQPKNTKSPEERASMRASFLQLANDLDTAP